MTLLDTIKQDSLTARKARETEKATTLVTLYAEAARVGKDKGNRDSTDEEVIETVRKFIKGLDASLTVLTQPEAIARANREKLVLESYLPALVTGEMLSRVIAGLVLNLTDKGPKSIGLVMTALRAQHGGAYDGAEASRLIKSALAN